MREVVEYLVDRGVEHLVHFTPISNLDRIRQEGIRPRADLEKGGEGDFVAMDKLRLDHREWMSCFSLSFPNFMMMRRYRIELQKHGEDVALLFIPIQRLIDFQTEHVFFYPSNAAASMSQQMAQEELIGLSAVREMFTDEALSKSGRQISRETCALPRFLTTDPQAEVQISGVVPWSSIAFVVVSDYEKKQELSRIQRRPPVYATWKVGGDDELNVFKLPSVWQAWIDKTEVNGGE